MNVICVSIHVYVNLPIHYTYAYVYMCVHVYMYAVCAMLCVFMCVCAYENVLCVYAWGKGGGCPCEDRGSWPVRAGRMLFCSFLAERLAISHLQEVETTWLPADRGAGAPTLLSRMVTGEGAETTVEDDNAGTNLCSSEGDLMGHLCSETYHQDQGP